MAALGGWESQLSWLLEGDDELPGEQDLVELLTSVLCRPAPGLGRRRSVSIAEPTAVEKSHHSRGGLDPLVARKLVHPSGHVDVAGSAMAWSKQLRGGGAAAARPSDAALLRRASSTATDAPMPAPERASLRRRASVGDAPGAPSGFPPPAIRRGSLNAGTRASPELRARAAVTAADPAVPTQRELPAAAPAALEPAREPQGCEGAAARQGDDTGAPPPYTPALVDELRTENARLTAALAAQEAECKAAAERMEAYAASQNEAAGAVKRELQRRAALRATKQAEVRERVLALAAERDAAVAALAEAQARFAAELEAAGRTAAAERQALLRRLGLCDSDVADSEAEPDVLAPVGGAGSPHISAEDAIATPRAEPSHWHESVADSGRGAPVDAPPDGTVGQ